MARLAVGALILLVFCFPVLAQEPFEGVTLISPVNSSDTFLIDMDGTVVRTWHGADRPASTAYLLADGSILRPCIDPDARFRESGYGGRLQIIDADDHVLWDYFFSTYDHVQHHDVEPIPNGNILLVAWERKTLEEAQAAGREKITTEMWPTMIV
jgi:hypothetical protein